MSRVAILKIRTGTLEQGLSLALQVWSDGQSPSSDLEGSLPSNSELRGLYACWRNSFNLLLKSSRSNTWVIEENLPTNSASQEIETCQHWVENLEAQMQIWLQSIDNQHWQRIRERLLQELASNSAEVRLVIQTSEPQLWKLPWHSWDLLQQYTGVSVVYSSPEFAPPQLNKFFPQKQVPILAVLGNSSHIDTEVDQQLIESLPGTAPTFLQQPPGKVLVETLRTDNWTIFFFAGHSNTEEERGRIYLNEGKSLTIKQFKYALHSAVQGGLQIAIFNSCDGLGLAQNLADVKIPVVIVMQEQVPDQVAQCFLREFLREYAGGKTLQTAVRLAQERLEEFTNLPGCTWLPMIFQNPAFTPPLWRELYQSQNTLPHKLRPSVTSFLRTALVASLCFTMLVFAARWQGHLQSQELKAFDLLMRQQPIAEVDSRLLVVLITEKDIEQLQQPPVEIGDGARSLSDQFLDSLVQQLQKYQPAIIGLDIFREGKIDGNRYLNLQANLKQGRLITACKGLADSNSSTIAAPQNTPLGKAGFVNSVVDKDNIIRRYLMLRGVRDQSLCRSPQLEVESLGLKLALSYLSSQGIKREDSPEDPFLTIGGVDFPYLEIHRGGYHRADSEVDKAYQTMLNYRPYRDLEDIAQVVSVTDVLRGNLTAKEVKGKIVLIGVDRPGPSR